MSEIELREDLGKSVILAEDDVVAEDGHLLGKEEPAKKIKHLVLAGGGTVGLVAFGALKAMDQQQGLWSKSDIESIDATSAGTILAIIIALKYDWDEAETYIVKRPWHNVMKSDLYSILGAFEQRGIWNMEIMEQVLFPLLLGKNLSKTVTLKEFFDVTKVDVHFYTSRMGNKCELVDISHLTHPTWTVVEAVYASSCVPILFAPLFKDGVGYVDGGMLLNYPLGPCLQRPNVDPGATLGIDKIMESIEPPSEQSSSLFDFLMYLMIQLIQSSWQRQYFSKIQQHGCGKKIQHEIYVASRIVTSMDLLRLSSSEEVRQKLIDEGVSMIASSSSSSSDLTKKTCL